jgi:hypothetical protein
MSDDEHGDTPDLNSIGLALVSIVLAVLLIWLSSWSPG